LVPVSQVEIRSDDVVLSLGWASDDAITSRRLAAWQQRLHCSGRAWLAKLRLVNEPRRSNQ
jgi:hypothetical protein